MGVSVYHTFWDGDAVSANWYTIDPLNADSENPGRDESGKPVNMFNIDDIPAPPNTVLWRPTVVRIAESLVDAEQADLEAHRQLVRYAIDRCWITPERLNIPGRSG